METSASTSGRSSSPTASSLSTPGTETPSERDEFERKNHVQEEEIWQNWRKAIVDSSIEYTEQMTFGQKRFWFLSHYIDDPTTFNIAYLGQLKGRLRAEDLTRAVETAAQRHEALRTRFFWSNNESKTPMQGILSKCLVHLETATIDSKAEAIQELETMRNCEWNFGDWVPLRMRLLSLSDTEHYLVIGTHHISLDGYSFSVLMLDINQAYNNAHPGHLLPLPPFPDTSQPRAFGAQQRSKYERGQFQPAIEHFRSIFPPADLLRPIELFSFSRTQVRPPLDRYDTHVARLHLEPAIATKLKQLAQAKRATSFSAYLGALQALLFRLLPVDTTDKVFIGIADANRLDSTFMNSIGNFLNVLPLRFDRTCRQTFGDAIEAAREKMHGALTHSGLPFDLLLDELNVPRSNAWAPVFQVFMNYRLIVREHADKNWAGCHIGEEKWYSARSGYDVSLEIVEDREGTILAVHVQKALYDVEAAELLVRSYANVLREVARQGNRVKLDGLQRWDKEDVKSALEIGKGPEMQLEWPITVAHRIDQMINQYPNSTALKDGYGRVLTYAAMDKRVENIAHALHEQLHENDKQAIVGVFQMPSADWICSLLAIHRIGAIYLPLDLRNSIPRLKSNITRAKPAAILTDSDMMGLTDQIGIDEHMAVINVSDLMTIEREKRETAAKPNTSAYIIFTSGSTGEPKGIVVTHAGLRVNLEGYHRAWHIPDVASVVLQQAAFSFDASLLMIYAALTTGGCLLVVHADARGDPTEVTRLMVEHGVTMTQATPSEYDMWFRFAPENLRLCTAWKAAWFGGERAADGVLDGFREICKVLPNLCVFTSYGPTEATISAMKGEADVRDPTLKVPVPGRLLPNYAAYIVDDELKPVPIGVPGEIMLGGAGVDNNEYLNRPDLTAAQFLTDPFAVKIAENPENGKGRMYRTGDYGRLNARGYLAVEGRIAGDTQIKLRGFRIELAEIERVIVNEAGGALAAVVTLRGEGDEDGFLAAHVVFEKKDEQTSKMIDKLRARLPLCLPQYMCPNVIVPLNEMPLTVSSKVDRRAVQALPLPKIEISIIQQQQNLTPTERRFVSLWATVLPSHALTQPFTPESDFFSAGGNSLLLVKLQAAIKGAFGDAPRLSRLMGAAKLGSMAALVDDGIGEVNWDKEIELDLSSECPLHTRSERDGSGLHILVTGATGSLGQRIVSRLVSDERVTQVVCLVRPTEGRDMMRLFPNIEDKIHIMPADLISLPGDLDLSEIDTVLHCAADRTFWDGYGPAKSVNVDAVKILAKQCLRTGTKLHVLSSGAVSEYEADNDSSNKSLPRPSPADGYVSSKWVAERYLALAARLTGLQVTAHRPTNAVNENDVAEEVAVIKAAMANDMVVLSTRLGVRPDFAHLSGTLDVAPIKVVAEDIADAIIEEFASEESKEKQQNVMHIVKHPGTAQIQIEMLGQYAEELFGRAENEAKRSLPAVPALHWVGLAKRAGFFEWFFAAQDLTVMDEKGHKIVTKR